MNLKFATAGGESFSALAKEYSICRSGQRGGNLGWLEARSLAYPELQQSVSNAEVGDIVKATTERGHHLIHVVAERSVTDRAFNMKLIR